jgi:hypothetical protein
MNKVNWIVVVAAALIILFGIGFLLSGRGYGGWGMMGPGMMGGWGFSPFGWIGMIFMWMIPLSFIILAVLGIVWIVRAIGSGTNPPPPGYTCPSCRRGVQADWMNCPYCGTPLAK